MSRLFLMVFAAGMFALAPMASADVPNCDCLDDYDVTWPDVPQNCLFVCPGAWGLPGHTPGDLTDNKICLYKDDLCSVGLAGYTCLRIDLSQVAPDSICVCEDECPVNGGTFPYIFPTAPTDGNGCTTFRFQGSILQMEEDLATAVDPALLQVCGCQDRPVRFRSTDIDADCVVGLSDNVIFSGAFVICPPQPTAVSYQHYTVYSGHCAPCPQAQLADNVIFSKHFDHACTPGPCDP